MLAGLLMGQAAVQGVVDEAVPVEPPPVAVLVFVPGQVRTLDVASVERVAVGNPEIADVTIVSSSEILIQAKQLGATNLILWEAQGQRELRINVADLGPEVIGQQIPALLEQLGLSTVDVRVEGGKVFLMGEVATDEQLTTLEQLAGSYPGSLVNLVTVRPAAMEPTGVVPLVRLSVQVVEINRTDLEKLGVKWSESLSFTHPALSGVTRSEVLTQWGTGLSRSSFNATLNALVQKNRARILSEPKLVTSSGKEASSFIGVEVPVIKATNIGTDSSSVNASIEFRQTGVLLRMTPEVHASDPDRKITIKMEAEVSGIDKTVGLNVPVGNQTILVPGFKVRRAETEVGTTSGETIVIAGLLEAEDTNDVSQLPGLGGMPVLGRLFRSPEIKSIQRELVIAVTPELLEDESQQVDRRLALEQALAVAEVTASVDDPRLRYALQIQDRIAKVLRYPSREKELNLEGTVKLRLHLFADGTLGRAMIAGSSGIESLDLEALKAAETQAPYPAFPSQLAEREMWLEVPVIFRP